MYTQFGGEMYFSDIYADRTLSEDIRSNKVLYGNRHSLISIITFLHHYECVCYCLYIHPLSTYQVRTNCY